MKFHKFKLRHAQIIALCMAVYDFVTVIAAYGLALWIRFDCQYQQIPRNYFRSYLQNICFHAAICLLLYWLCYLYNSIWRFASYNELIRITIGVSLTVAIHSIYMNVFVIRMPISYFVFGGVIQYVFSLGIRFGYRFILLFNYGKNNRTDNCARVMIVGAGAAGQLIMRDISRTAEVKENVCCFIDDNPNKWRRSMDGIPVVGGRERILEACKNYKIDKIYVTIPSAARKDKREILNICKESGCELKDLPEMYHLYTGNLSVSNMRNVTMEDLLGREPVSVNMDEIFEALHGKTILVTGGGGSIGSELCRQIASHQPGRLVIFDIYENNAYDIQMELLHDHPELAVNVEIGSVRDSRRLFKLFDDYHPEIVYHAAAHKHVPLMEDSPCEAIKNNTIGTYKTAYAAMAHGCQRFVLISTDKAVNPSNIMGASKRLCEMVIQAFDHMIKAGQAADIPQLFTHPVFADTQLPLGGQNPAWASTGLPQYAYS
ncbi:MAG: polysaccharide biosynthesis protein, partial [Lachnospiraceae bacterium]|nr:polysaccharide biosynthesis protein [Lachnospiraceae bacterium]